MFYLEYLRLQTHT